MDALEKLLIRFGQLVAEQPLIKDIKVNPLLASPRGMMALDARMTLFESDQTAAYMLKLVIRPYLTEYVHSWNLADERLLPFARSDQKMSQ